MNELIVAQTNTLQKMLEANKDAITAALPSGLTPDRMLRIAVTEARKNTDLLQCDQASFLGAVIQASQLGLELGGSLGHAYLVPFKNNKVGRKEVQFILGYRGMLDLVRRSKACTHVTARAVYEGDTFEYEYGLEEKLVHKSSPKPGAKLTHVYAIAFMKEGKPLFDVMDIVDIEMIRSRAGTDKIWSTDYDAMAKKSVIRRLFKYMPVSIEVQQAIGLDEMADAGVSQGNGAFIQAEGTTLPDKVASIEAKLGINIPKTEAPKPAEILPPEAPPADAPTVGELPGSNPLGFYQVPVGPLEGKMLKDVPRQVLKDFYNALNGRRVEATGKWLELLTRLDQFFEATVPGGADFADSFANFAQGPTG